MRTPTSLLYTFTMLIILLTFLRVACRMAGTFTAVNTPGRQSCKQSSERALSARVCRGVHTGYVCAICHNVLYIYTEPVRLLPSGWTIIDEIYTKYTRGGATKAVCVQESPRGEPQTSREFVQAHCSHCHRFD